MAGRKDVGYIGFTAQAMSRVVTVTIIRDLQSFSHNLSSPRELTAIENKQS